MGSGLIVRGKRWISNKAASVLGEVCNKLGIGKTRSPKAAPYYPYISNPFDNGLQIEAMDNPIESEPIRENVEAADQFGSDQEKIDKLREDLSGLLQYFDEKIKLAEENPAENNRDIAYGLRLIQRKIIRAAGLKVNGMAEYELMPQEEINFDDFLRDILEAMDLLGFAIEAVSNDPGKANDKIISSVVAFQAEKLEMLAKYGVAEIIIIPGEDTFNPNLHEAIAAEFSDKPKGEIIAVRRTGYLYRVSFDPTRPFIYPAVVVSKGPQT